MPDEQALISALRRRDPGAFATVFERYADKIYRLAAGILEDEVEADGVVQDTFLRLFERLDSFEGRSRLGTWLYRVAYNGAVDRLRRRRPTVSLEAAGDGLGPAPALLADWSQLPEQALSTAEVQAALDEAIAALPEAYRTVFILREVERLSTDETAEIMSLSAGAVKVRLHRARLFLRERLAEQFARES
ncbi:MAG: sigma-70 family RNA polymerase sigma factor [Anaerolineae bacterium]|nr:sigma-70 family RNA polymerase sigma factor [Anaerolineae bacterium]